MSNNFAFTENGSRFEFQFPTFKNREHHFRNVFAQGKPLDVTSLLPYSYFQLIFSENHDFSSLIPAAKFNNRFTSVPKNSQIFDLLAMPEFNQFIRQQTSLDVRQQPLDVKSFDPKLFNPVRCCRMLCEMPATKDFDFAVRNAKVQLFLRQIRPSHRVRFGLSTNNFFMTEINIYEFNSNC